MANDFTWHAAALKAKNSSSAAAPPIHDGRPEHGFYFAKAGKAGGRIPVRIQIDKNGDTVAISGTSGEHRVGDASNVWTWVAKNPVDRSDYVYAWMHAKWPDGTPVTAPEAPPAMGDNLPDDPFERLLAEVNDKLDSARAFVGDSSAKQDMTRADQARNMQAELLRYKSSADAMHKAEKQPHLDAGRAVDDKFRFREKLDVAAKALRTIFGNIAAAEEARQRDEARKKFEAERAAAEAERARIAAEREEKMKHDPIAAMTDPEPELPELPTGPEEVKVKIGGGVGRSASLRTEYVGEIIDYEATLDYFAKSDEIRAEIAKLVRAAVRIGKDQTEIPGVKVKAVRRAS